MAHTTASITVKLLLTLMMQGSWALLHSAYAIVTDCPSLFNRYSSVTVPCIVKYRTIKLHINYMRWNQGALIRRAAFSQLPPSRAAEPFIFLLCSTTLTVTETEGAIKGTEGYLAGWLIASIFHFVLGRHAKRRRRPDLK